MTTFFCLALLMLPVIIVLPFIYLGRSSMKKDGISQHILKPGPRRYTIAVPENYSGTEALPLVLALHYGGHGAPYYGRFFLTEIVKLAFGDLDAIFVAPDCPTQDWLQPESEKFVFDLIDYVQTEFKIDPERILVTGFSLGGIGTWHFAGRFAERFTAAIVMAGYVGASIAAELGSMMVSEEIIALETSAIDPIRFLVLPRLFASMVMLPCLTVLTNLVGLLGGFIIGTGLLDISAMLYVRRTCEALRIKYLAQGLIKVEAFAIAIVLIACYEGLNVRGGAEGVGKATTDSVVKAIVFIIVADLLFTSVFFYIW